MENSLYDKIVERSFRWKLLIICCLTAHLYIIYGFFFLMADESVVAKFIGAVIDLFLLFLTIKYLYPREAPTERYNYLLLGLVSLAVIFNVFPFFQGFTLYDDIFASPIEMLPQIKFGYPNTYLKNLLVEPEYLEEEGIAPLIFHPASILTNAFYCSLFITVYLRIHYSYVLEDSTWLWTLKNQD